MVVLHLQHCHGTRVRRGCATHGGRRPGCCAMVVTPSPSHTKLSLITCLLACMTTFECSQYYFLILCFLELHSVVCVPTSGSGGAMAAQQKNTTRPLCCRPPRAALTLPPTQVNNVLFCLCYVVCLINDEISFEIFIIYL